MKKVLLAVLAMLLLPAGFAFAADKSPLEISGDYQFRYDSLEGTVHSYNKYTPTTPAPTFTPTPGYDVKNSGLMTNRFGLNIKAEALEDVRVKARLVMYKVYGHQSNMGYNPFMGDFFADRYMAANDGTTGHVPGDGSVIVDYAYATVSNVFDQPIWVSVGRRPSTGGAPGNLRLNVEKAGSAGIPNIMVDYAFDGATIGWAPYIESLPGAYVKLCAGRGYDSGFLGNPSVAGTKNTDFVGLNVVPYDEDKLHIELQYQLGKNIFDAPSDSPNLSTNLGDIEWIGGVVTSKMGNLNLFVSAAMSKTDPNGNTSNNAGLLNSGPVNTEDHSGNAVYVGGRYDMGNTKIGAEFNRGSEYWIGMVPAADDVWTAKLGTRGSVYEVYIIQELKRAKVSKNGKAYVRLGYQYYDFEYTGSNNWVGAPLKIADLSAADPNNKAQFFAPLETASDLYFTFNVEF